MNLKDHYKVGNKVKLNSLSGSIAAVTKVTKSSLTAALTGGFIRFNPTNFDAFMNTKSVEVLTP